MTIRFKMRQQELTVAGHSEDKKNIKPQAISFSNTPVEELKARANFVKPKKSGFFSIEHNVDDLLGEKRVKHEATAVAQLKALTDFGKQKPKPKPNKRTPLMIMRDLTEFEEVDRVNRTTAVVQVYEDTDQTHRGQAHVRTSPTKRMRLSSDSEDDYCDNKENK